MLLPNQVETQHRGEGLFVLLPRQFVRDKSLCLEKIGRRSDAARLARTDAQFVLLVVELAVLLVLSSFGARRCVE